MAVAAYSSSSKADREQIGQARPATAVVCLFILFKMIGKVQQDSFQSLRIQIDQGHSEPFGFSLGSPSPLGDSLSSLDRDCSVGSGRSLTVRSQNQTQLRSPVSPLHSRPLATRQRCAVHSRRTALASTARSVSSPTGPRRFATSAVIPSIKQIFAAPTTVLGSAPTGLAATSCTPWTRCATAPCRHRRRSPTAQ